MNEGKIVQIIGPVVDVEFSEGKIPAILNALNIERTNVVTGQNEILVTEVQQLRLLYGFDVFKSREAERIVVLLQHLLDGAVEILRIAFDHFRCFDAQRAVEKIIERRQPSFKLQLVQRI